MKVPYPTDKTLKKYGLTKEDYALLYRTQEGTCAICGHPFTGRINIDHEHVKGWKQMPDEKRRLYVRGLLCWTCNHLYVGRGATTERMYRAWLYLRSYDLRQAELAKDKL